VNADFIGNAAPKADTVIAIAQHNVTVTIAQHFNPRSRAYPHAE
jgi:hypothetical protein